MKLIFVMIFVSLIHEFFYEPAIRNRELDRQGFRSFRLWFMYVPTSEHFVEPFIA